MGRCMGPVFAPAGGADLRFKRYKYCDLIILIVGSRLSRPLIQHRDPRAPSLTYCCLIQPPRRILIFSKAG